MMMKVKCLRHLGDYDRAIDEVRRFLLQESYISSSERGFGNASISSSSMIVAQSPTVNATEQVTKQRKSAQMLDIDNSSL